MGTKRKLVWHVREVHGCGGAALFRASSGLREVTRGDNMVSMAPECHSRWSGARPPK